MAKKTGSYFVKLETSENSPPTLISKVKPTGRLNRYQVSILHPNTLEVLYDKVHTCETLDQAMKVATELKKNTELKHTKTWYEEKKFIPAPKKGKMKLYTKEVAEEERLNSEGSSGKVKATPKKKKTVKKPLKKAISKKTVLEKPKKKQVEKKKTSQKKVKNNPKTKKSKKR